MGATYLEILGDYFRVMVCCMLPCSVLNGYKDTESTKLDGEAIRDRLRFHTDDLRHKQAVIENLTPCKY